VTEQERPPKPARAHIQAWVDRPTHQELRVRLAQHDKTLQALIEEAVERFLSCCRTHDPHV
jgi:hypothetical protein